MNTINLRILIFTILTAIIMLSAECGGEKTEKFDFTDYTIVRSDFSTDEETMAAVALKKYFSEYKGLDLKLTTDWQSTSETAPAKEIIVGKAERGEYDEFLGKLKDSGNLAYGIVGEKLILYAPDSDGLIDIVGKFSDDVLASGSSRELRDGVIYEYTVSEKLVRTDGEELMSELKDRIMWGVNAHNRGYKSYGEAYTEDYIKLAAELGSGIYRINYNPTNDEMTSYVKKIAESCHRYGMKVMLVLDDMSGSVDEISERMKYIAGNLQDDIDYFQIFNETDIWCSKNDDGSFYNISNWTGMTIDYYNPERVSVCVEKMRAALGAFHETAPDAELVVNIGSRHYPMLDWYVEAGLEWDIIAFDIYDLDVWDHHAFLRSMEDRYPGCDLMVAECNYPANSGEFTDEEQAEWLTAFMKIMNSYDSDRLIGVIIYELMDEPNFEENGERNGEAHFGIVATNPDFTIGEPKTAYRAVQKLLCGGECGFRKIFEENG